MIRPISHRHGRTIWAVLGFLILFAILFFLVTKFYLQPAFEHAQHATHAQRRKLAANSMLLMVLLLTVLLVGLLLTFRISRFFQPRETEKRTRTKVIDAWAEAGKRIDEPDED